MPHVNPVKAACQAEIRTIIHDQHRSAADHTPQFTAMANHLCCCGPLISVLNEGGSAIEQLLRELHGLLQRIFSILKHGSVNDRVQRRKFVMLRNHYSALGRTPTAEHGIPRAVYLFLCPKIISPKRKRKILRAKKRRSG